MRIVALTIVSLTLIWPLGCNGTDPAGNGEETVTEAVNAPPPPGNTDALMLAQAYFESEVDPATGKLKPVTAPAKLTLIRGTGEQWESEVLEDPESNVFHKALMLENEGEAPRILTIGANAARLKSWQRSEGGWTSTTHWAPTFGGQQERLRDLELGDVTGDGRPDAVIATHDKGVVAVVEIPADGSDWIVHEVDRTEGRTFVHEIEIGDVDGDGAAEFFATPSAPNVLDGTPQPGRIVGYRWNGSTAERFEVDSFLGAHVKEILAADMEGRGKADLYASIEPERKKSETGVVVDDPLIIRRYRFEGDQVLTEDIATFRDHQCRFLIQGDLTGDGIPELIASTMSTGVWMLRQSDAGWTSELIDEDSPNHEFEHAASVIDLDNDGKMELYVVSDNRPDLEGMVRRYQWNGTSFDKQEIQVVPADHMTFNVTAGRL